MEGKSTSRIEKKEIESRHPRTKKKKTERKRIKIDTPPKKKTKKTMSTEIIKKKKIENSRRNRPILYSLRAGEISHFLFDAVPHLTAANLWHGEMIETIEMPTDIDQKLF